MHAVATDKTGARAPTLAWAAPEPGAEPGAEPAMTAVLGMDRSSGYGYSSSDEEEEEEGQGWSDDGTVLQRALSASEVMRLSVVDPPLGALMHALDAVGVTIFNRISLIHPTRQWTKGPARRSSVGLSPPGLSSEPRAMELTARLSTRRRWR